MRCLMIQILRAWMAVGLTIASPPMIPTDANPVWCHRMNVIPADRRPDVPTPVTLTSLTGTTSVLPALGAAAAGLGWAALRSARREEDEEDTPLED